MRQPLFLLACAVMLISVQGSAQDKKAATTAPAADSSKTAAPNKQSIADKVKSSRKIDGLFTVYQDTATGSVQLYVKKNQLGKEFIYQSFSMSGPTALYLNQSMHRANLVFQIQKFFDKLEFSRVNTSMYYDQNNAIARTRGVDVPEAVFLNEKVVAEDSTGYLVSADGLFLSEKLDPVKPLLPPGVPPGAVFNLGSLNLGKSKYHLVRSYPQNTDILVDLAYDNPAPYNSGGRDITDARYVRVRMQHSFIEMPQNDFRPRFDDPRVGYFMQEVNDQTSKDVVNYRDMINRWHLTKKDPTAALSEPVEPIVWWVENTTPVEYRDIIVEAGEKWNEAFEKAGFKNAVVMKIMPDNADWDPGDIRMNVIRWVSSANPPYGAIGPSFVNPRTGQILGADITIEWNTGSIKPILYDLYTAAETLQESTSTLGHHQAVCGLATELKAQLMAGFTIAEATGADEKELMEIHKQFLYFLVLHEMGHTLGLNHNMKASQIWTPAEIHNKELTRKHGLTGSVMDYPAINIAIDKSKQGDYYTTKVGPYDIWAIEYGYTPCEPGDEKGTLKKILARSTDPRLTFGNDADDMRSPGKAIDPRVMVNDMSGDMIAYGEERLKLVNTVMGKIREKSKTPDKSFVELRSRFNILNGQRYSMVSAISRYIGGVYVDRSFVGQSNGKPFTPVSLETQKKAMNLLSKYVFAPEAFAADEKVFPYLQMQRRGFNFFSSTEDPKLTTGYLQIQHAALSHILHPTTLQRITNSRLYGNQYSAADVLNDLMKGIFAADMKGKVNVYRQYLQIQFVKQLASIADISSSQSPYDEVAKAAARNTLKKIKVSMATAVSPDEETRAHRANVLFHIDNALSVK